MLCRTHFLFKFNPFPHLSSSSHLQEMESAQGNTEGVYAAAAGDDFSVDELLDFSNGYSETEEQLDEPRELEMEETKTSPVSPEKQKSSPEKHDFAALNESVLSFQAEGLESLEWLSHFVEDSFSDYSLAGKFPSQNRPETVVVKTERQRPCFTWTVQTKARTKRARVGVRFWPVLSPSFTEAATTSSSSSTSSTTSFFPFLHTRTEDYSPAKKRKKKAADGGGGAAAQPRRCSHCGVTKTPQWRAGPLGSKTLCNACGVRYKSGRLLPEYRPACSPTFSSELHSNNHRKVLEMRRKKDVEVETAAGSGDFKFYLDRNEKVGSS